VAKRQALPDLRHEAVQRLKAAAATRVGLRKLALELAPARGRRPVRTPSRRLAHEPGPLEPAEVSAELLWRERLAGLRLLALGEQEYQLLDDLGA
jgi:hypothetical protein